MQQRKLLMPDKKKNAFDLLLQIMPMQQQKAQL
jgi:hypothetical protein